ncbi:MAG: hypothetical protein HYS17_08545 [Micavibrio aeruginosavorus]|uniref:Uncharacterized protein n=1 Tax=Micavibrio aeruginosavorus TaxID=349221 RepID=A0A7T5UHF7_9BACT|nr:MAG: hypothetical protein HYS17_08545 [Micavibrio aeruginosavorus]
MTTPAPNSRAILRMALYASAIPFGIAGLLCLFDPEIVQGVVGFDSLTLTIMGAALLLSALGDIIVAKFIFKDKR